MNWVVIKETISEVEFFDLVYAWLAKGLSNMVLTSNATIIHKTPHCERFDDIWGKTDFCEL